jgi:hypothetical protein
MRLTRGPGVNKIEVRTTKKPMTPKVLRSRIAKLPPTTPITMSFERTLRRAGIWGLSKVWYSTQKEHWLGWLAEYDGPGFYSRVQWDRPAQFAYNHIVCPPMVLWLGEAVGVPEPIVHQARRAALTAGPSLAAMSGAIRRNIPWSLIESRLHAVQTRSELH